MRPRLLKEARPLAAPAALTLAATVLALTWLPATLRGWSIGPAVLAFHLGAAFLVALPFGAEFQQRTMVLLLSQPVGRVRVWLEKWTVLVVVIALLAATQYAALQAGPFAGLPVGFGLAFLALLLCSGTFWTLVAGSTIGGAAFSLAALMVLEMAANAGAVWLSGAAIDLFAAHPVVAAARVVYSLTTLWAGWRIFSRFEAKGHGAGMAFGTAAAASPGMLRCRPAGVLRNLFRKELRLHGPAFQIAGVFALCWLLAVAYFALAHDRPRTADLVFTLMLFIYFPLALIVAATISVGEDTALGTRAWHVTLPVSTRVQWLVKLGVSAAVAAALAVALPAALGEVVSAAVLLPGARFQLPQSPAFLIVTAGVLVLGFWAATVFGHPVRAAVATGVAVLALALCAMAGSEAGMRLRVGSSVMTWLMVRNQWPPDAFFFVRPSALQGLVVPLMVTLVGSVALAQSLAAFRRAHLERRTLTAYGLQLAAVAFLGTAVVMAYARAAGDQWRSAPVRELTAAIEAVARPGPASLSLADLEPTGALSAPTRAWLARSDISVTSRTIHLRPRTGAPSAPRVVYHVRVSFPNGREYRTIVWAGESERR